ncbi:MAG: SDR family NAD(P)-dependent oxidoreductase [Actinomycetota bacterium]|nr:SDR family NAD(P)-dependent oxidoreductase [Actinomycetota bacterium]
MTIAGSQVVLTGASGGLGGAVARALDDRGAHLILTGRRVDVLDALAEGLKDARVLKCDLADRVQVEDLLAQVEDADILVANAALPATGTLDDFTTEELDRALDVNLRAPMLLAKHLAPRMAARGRGHLVFISSMGAKLPASRLSIYAATKYGLRGFAACLRQELAPSGVGVSAVFPGSVEDVGMWAESGASGKGGTVSSSAVADGVIRAIRRNKAEVDVAPWSIRLTAAFAYHLPGAFARAARQAGADQQTAALAAGLRHKR